MTILPQAVINRIWVLVIAAATDLLIGDPLWLWHPVQGIGTLISASEIVLRRLFRIPVREEAPSGHHTRERIAGICMVLIVLTVNTGLILFLLILCQKVHPYLRIFVEGVLCGRLLALRSLGVAGISVRDPLLKGDIEGGRKAVSMIVGRDTERLDAEGIAKAAVETVAENTSDGVTAPLFYMILLGGIGGIFYKAVNTMDSMAGYKNARYRYFGTAAARLDDIMNYIPSRLTAIFMILACFLPGKTAVLISGRPAKTGKYADSSEEKSEENTVLLSGKPVASSEERLDQNTVPVSGKPKKNEKPQKSGIPGTEAAPAKEEDGAKVLIPDGAAAFRIWRRDRLKSPSPNSAQTESVCAGALHLRLLGDTWYFGEVHHKAEIGDGGRRVEPEDITRSVRLMYRTAFLMFAAGIAALCLML